MSSMNRSMLSPTFAESGDRAMLAAAMVSAALRMLVIMSGFLRGEEVDAVLQFVGRKHAVSDRDRAPGHAVPQYERRGNAGLEPHARPLAAFDLVVGEVPGRSAIGRDSRDSDMTAVRHRAPERAHTSPGPPSRGP